MNMGPARICVITTVSITLKTFLIDQLVFLSRHGFEITVVCDHDPDFAASLPEEIAFVPISMTRGWGLFSTIKGLCKLRNLFKIKDFDLIQYSTPKAAFISSLAGWMASIPVRLYCQWGIRYVGFSGLKRAFFKGLEKITCSCSTHIAPDSNGNLEFGIKEGLYPVQKGSLVHRGSANGVNLNRFDISQKITWRRHIRAELGILEDAFVYGFVGRLTRDKGLNDLIPAFSSMDDPDQLISLLLVGPEEDNHGLQDGIINEIKNNSHIYPLGHKDNPQEYIAAMDVMVLPSYREGFGVAAIEAQAMGVPVVTTDIPGPSEAILNGKTGILVPPGDFSSLKQAMEKLRYEPDLLRELGDNAYQYASQYFEQTQFWEKVLEHRRKLLGRQ